MIFQDTFVAFFGLVAGKECLTILIMSGLGKAETVLVIVVHLANLTWLVQPFDTFDDTSLATFRVGDASTFFGEIRHTRHLIVPWNFPKGWHRNLVEKAWFACFLVRFYIVGERRESSLREESIWIDDNCCGIVACCLKRVSQILTGLIVVIT